jgi:hypothetical protein
MGGMARWLSRRLLSPWVYEGQDRWLFLIGGSNSIGALYDRDAPLLNEAKLRQWIELIENRAGRLERMGIEIRPHQHPGKADALRQTNSTIRRSSIGVSRPRCGFAKCCGARDTRMSGSI